jgi:hypothetical protein
MTPRKRRKRRVANWILFLLVPALAFLLLSDRMGCRRAIPGRRADVVVYADVIERTLVNYGDVVLTYAVAYELPPEYLLALIVLESSGRSIIPPRFEPHVYERLKEVQNGARKGYEHVKQQHLADATDEALKNLASSWGPFQLMGYKCLLLDIKVRDIRGKDAIFWGIHWIDLTYGKKLKDGKFRDAFHIHNTGRTYPLRGRPFTHDPEYVEKGLRYMQEFKKRLT